MTYLVSFPTEGKPKWFNDRYDDLIHNWNRPWTWTWNEAYQHKVSIRNGMINLVFENEQEYTWFILKEL